MEELPDQEREEMITEIKALKAGKAKLTRYLKEAEDLIFRLQGIVDESKKIVDDEPEDEEPERKVIAPDGTIMTIADFIAWKNNK